MTPPVRSNVPLSFTVWIIWFALLSAIVIYGVIGQQFATSGPDPESAPASGLVQILTLISALCLGAGFVVRFLFLSRPLQGKPIPLDNPDHFQRYLATQMVIFALCEAVAIFGLILRLTGEVGPRGFFAFLSVAFVALLLHAPVHLPLQLPKATP